MELRRRAKQTKLLLLAALVLLSWLATQTISDAILQARFAGQSALQVFEVDRPGPCVCVCVLPKGSNLVWT